MTIIDRLKEIRERADKATKGPWFGMFNSPDTKASVDISAEDEHGAFVVLTLPGDYPEREANLEFLSHVRDDVPKLVEVVEIFRPLIEGMACHCDSVIGGKYDCARCQALARATEVLNG